jgi:hypothetical protein
VNTYEAASCVVVHDTLGRRCRPQSHTSKHGSVGVHVRLVIEEERETIG